MVAGEWEPSERGRPVDMETVRRMCELTSMFYQQTSRSFDATRQAGWPGWQRVMEAADLPRATQVSVVDLACGNLRFERYLLDAGVHVHAWALDSCDELAEMGRKAFEAGGGACELSYQHLDVLATLLAGEDLASAIEAPTCDLCVAFGFMHHVPTHALRAQVLQALVAHARVGGLVAVSFWQFAKNARLMSKAEPVANGDTGDYLLGWQDREDVHRYCHSFTEKEIDELALGCAPQARELQRFSTDGRTGDLNRYLILQRCE